MFRNEITINTISLRSNSSERLGRCGGKGRGEEKKERKKKKRSIVPPTCTRG